MKDALILLVLRIRNVFIDRAESRTFKFDALERSAIGDADSDEWWWVVNSAADPTSSLTEAGVDRADIRTAWNRAIADRRHARRSSGDADADSYNVMLQDPLNPNNPINRFREELEIFFTVFFTAELVLQVVATGTHRHST